MLGAAVVASGVGACVTTKTGPGDAVGLGVGFSETRVSRCVVDSREGSVADGRAEAGNEEDDGVRSGLVA